MAKKGGNKWNSKKHIHKLKKDAPKSPKTGKNRQTIKTNKVKKSLKSYNKKIPEGAEFVRARRLPYFDTPGYTVDTLFLHTYLKTCTTCGQESDIQTRFRQTLNSTQTKITNPQTFEDLSNQKNLLDPPSGSRKNLRKLKTATFVLKT